MATWALTGVEEASLTVLVVVELLANGAAAGVVIGARAASAGGVGWGAGAVGLA